MSRASSKRGRGASSHGAPAARRGGTSRAEVYAQYEQPVPEPAGPEADFAPAFGDFPTGPAVQSAFARALEELGAGAAEKPREGAGNGLAGGDGTPVDGEGVRAGADGALAGGDAGALPGALELGRVARLDRGYPLVVTAGGSYRAEHAIALVKGTDTRSAVGDWVVLRLSAGHDKARIERVLPRLSVLSRWDGGPRGERQVLAANLDVLMVAQPLSKKDVPLDRIVRSVVLANEGGIRPAVVLTKADRSPDARRLEADVRAVREAVGSQVPVVVTSVVGGRGVEEARALIPRGGTALLLGESGAGKSTLVNALLGAEVLGVGAVRDRDDQGRHTTVARRMLKVPGAGVLVDAPGLRSLPLLDEERGLARTFPEVANLVPACRFRDCTHGGEPGCAVRAAVGEGAVGPERLEEYRLLAAEMRANRLRLDPSARSSITQ